MGLVPAGAWPPGGCLLSLQEERGLCCQGQDKPWEGLLGTGTCFSQQKAQGLVSGASTGQCVCYSAWGGGEAGLWGLCASTSIVRFHLRLRFSLLSPSLLSPVDDLGGRREQRWWFSFGSTLVWTWELCGGHCVCVIDRRHALCLLWRARASLKAVRSLPIHLGLH